MVVAAEGYPDAPVKGDEIDGLEVFAKEREECVDIHGSRAASGCWIDDGEGAHARASLLQAAEERETDPQRRRRILDVMPLLMLLLAMVFKERIGWFPRATILLGVAVHAYGIFVWNVLGFVA